ncbi:MAG: hypothetical protein ACM3SY_15300 [Candidatus Omnitrophota bacterium]
MVFRLENDLEKAAEPFLKDKNFLYSWQVPIHNRVIDLAAIDPNGAIIGIEFKLKDWKRALKQAARNSNAFDYIYICVPGGNYLNRLTVIAEKSGIGVLIYDTDIGTIKIQSPAKRIAKQWKPDVEFVRDYIEARGIK